MALPRADCVPWASVTSPLPQAHLGIAERLIGLIRRECIGPCDCLGEAHLRRILTKYAAYYNELRTHRCFNKDVDESRIADLARPLIV